GRRAIRGARRALRGVDPMRRLLRYRGAAPLALGALLVGMTLAGCGRSTRDSGGDDEPSAEALVPVRVAALEQRPFADAGRGPGSWRGGGELVVPAPFAAEVRSIAVHAGDRVQAGQPLAALTTAESQATIRGAELMLREARDSTARAEARRALAQARRE